MPIRIFPSLRLRSFYQIFGAPKGRLPAGFFARAAVALVIMGMKGEFVNSVRSMDALAEGMAAHGSAKYSFLQTPASPTICRGL